MAESLKRKHHILPECNKEVVALSLRLLQESINDLKNTKGCSHVRGNNKLSKKNYEENLFNKKQDRDTYQKSSIILKDFNKNHNHNVKNSGMEMFDEENEKIKKPYKLIKEDVENLNSEQLSKLKHKLLHTLKTKHSRTHHIKPTRASSTHKHKTKQPPPSYPTTKTSKKTIKTLHSSTKPTNKSSISNNKKSSATSTQKHPLTSTNNNASNTTHLTHTNIPHTHNPPTTATTTLPKSTTKFKMNIAGLPFISGKSTTKSHSLSANLQEVLYLMKHNNTKTFSTKSFTSTCHRSCMCNKQQQQQHDKCCPQHQQQQQQRQPISKTNHNDDDNDDDDDNKYNNDMDNYSDDDEEDDDNDYGGDYDESAHHHVANDDEDDDDDDDDNEEEEEDDDDNEEEEEEDDDDDDDDDDDEMLNELLEQLADELCNLKARHCNLVGLEGYEDRVAVLEGKMHTKQKQMRKLQEFMKEQHALRGGSFLKHQAPRRGKMERKGKESRTEDGKKRDKEVNKESKVTKKTTTVANKRTSNVTVTQTSNHTSTHTDKHTTGHRGINIVPTAKQKYTGLLKDLQQIQNSLKNDVR